MKKALIWIGVVAVLAAAAYFAFEWKFSTPDRGYIVEKVRRGDISSYVSATGMLDPKVSVLVGTEVSGTIREIFVENNTPVKKGQVLLKLDQDLFRAKVDQERANLRSAEAKLAELTAARDMEISSVDTALAENKAILGNAYANHERKRLLHNRGMISREEYDLSVKDMEVAEAKFEQAKADKAKYKVVDAQIEAGKAAVDQARASLNTAETNLEKTVIRAPIDGVVINKNIEVGQTFAASFTTPELLDVGDLSVMEVETSIDEADVGQVTVGKKAEFTVDAFPDKVFAGEVSMIHYAPEVVQNVVTYKGIIDVDNPDALLRPGMTANVKIITNEKKGVLLIPNSALRVKLDAGEKGASGPAKEKAAAPAPPAPPGTRTVWVMRGGKPEAANVMVGVTDFTQTEVVEGLDEGDEVVVEALEEGEKPARNTRGSSRRIMRMVH